MSKDLFSCTIAKPFLISPFKSCKTKNLIFKFNRFMNANQVSIQSMVATLFVIDHRMNRERFMITAVNSALHDSEKNVKN